MGNSVGYILPLEEKKFVDLAYNVNCNDFEGFVSYDKKNFGREKIWQFIRDIIKGAQKSDLYGYHRKVHMPFVEETINSPYCLFPDRINICFTAEKKKKHGCLTFTCQKF